MAVNLYRAIALSGFVAVALLMAAGRAEAANGAYAVDAADISDLGSCKVESWYSMATNSDFAAVANPSCVVEITRPVELSVLTNHSRSDGKFSTSLAPKARSISSRPASENSAYRRSPAAHSTR